LLAGVQAAMNVFHSPGDPGDEAGMDRNLSGGGVESVGVSDRDDLRFMATFTVNFPGHRITDIE